MLKVVLFLPVSFQFSGRSAQGTNDEVGGEQPGEMFGTAVAACDLNGDGLDDLVIGAPFYTPTNKVIPFQHADQ